ncbi:metal ABC transporter ATP-binding protein [Lactiplantibacillus mudanjiangensis]|uniref:Manganese ABC transporter ATP-binding protein [Lactobacillus heilongjiangensis] n=1 Tax=Lactiplantibacillus mudanjiangensis TaxID=1296538 RepID=A0A660E524_9LACO|nr:metal ABC transporter ATP-binding protein [Lactiplantibacillus mudanjiangensis]VDG19497.1 manganese ABC transporter ATP-binding protein [Lactobacillus heilongjiangensis] [Lactiplantibacillus mudanjiangensis]VDG25800.1 manganese ABC transporter ATP-binding protein [Lactobacillus heilongjiangensis] [Lactiplantibacillus mudanjiangensis]VDG28126.1 manganese ABC transporter ATP-binding protein [Lactobacillus heilongjiangensis] [Lactiplantibacillus mudanjiangensis]
MLSIKNLTVAYDDTPVLTDVAVNFNAGKITGIIGPNGAGKSTLIKAMLGLIKSKHGTATYNNQPLTAVRQQIAYVEQRKDIDLTFPINVLDVVLTGTYGHLGLFKSPGKAEKQASLAALAQVSLSDFAKRQIGNLSGGQLQRVFVARAIVQAAEIIILDEPFVGIDLQSETAIVQILKQWRDAGKTIIVVHHDLNKVTRYFDELVILNHGIVAAGATTDVYNPTNISQAFSTDLSSVLFDQPEVPQS